MSTKSNGDGVMHPISHYTAIQIDALPRQATTDDQLVGLWLHGRSAHTPRAYAADAERFRSYVGPLTTATLGTYRPSLTALTVPLRPELARSLRPSRCCHSASVSATCRSTLALR